MRAEGAPARHARGAAGVAGAAGLAALLAAGMACGGDGSGAASTRAAAVVRCLTDPGCDDAFAAARRGSVYFAAENTVAAAELALDDGASIVHVDVRSSADAALVLMADATVDRTTTGTGEVGALTLAQLDGLEVLPPDERGQINDEVVFLATTGLTVRVRGRQPVPELAELLRAVEGRAAVALDLALPAEGVARAVRQVRALGALAQTLFLVDDAAEARAALAEDGDAVLVLRPEDSGEWQRLRALQPQGRPPIVEMNATDPGFAAVRREVSAAGGTLWTEALGTTDTVASLAEASARRAGASPGDALAAARIVYEAQLRATGARVLETDRIDLVAPFVDDFNLVP